MCPKQGMTVFLAIKTHTNGSVFIRFTGKHFKIEEIKTSVIKIVIFSTKVVFFRMVFFRLSSRCLWPLKSG